METPNQFRSNQSSNIEIKKIFTHNDIFLNKKTPVPIGHSFPSKLNKKTQKYRLKKAEQISKKVPNL